MLITVTYIRLRNPGLFFRLSMFGYQVMKQAQSTPGFIKMKNTGFWNNHYTLSAWENHETMQQFARSGAHLNAMKSSKSLAKTLSTYTYESETFPDWATAKKLIHANGKVLKFD